MTPKSVLLTIAVAGLAMAIPIENNDAAIFSNSNISCNWQDAAGLVRDFQTYKLNETNVVAQCANACVIGLALEYPVGVLDILSCI